MRTSESSNVIEFIGMMGAGKSTIARNVQNLCIEAGFNSSDIKDIEKSFENYLSVRSGFFDRLINRFKWSFFYSFVKYPKVSFYSLINALCMRPVNRTSIKRVVFICRYLGFVNYYNKLISNNCNEVLIYEEAVLHGGLTLQLMYGYSFNQRVCRCLIKSLLDVFDRNIVYVKSDPIVALKRNRLRNLFNDETPMNLYRYSSATPKEAEDLYIHYSTVLDFIADVCKEHCPKRFIEVDSNLNSPEENARYIFDRIQNGD